MILTRDQVIAKIEDRLAGRINDAGLAQWAFDQTYAFELEELDYEAGAEDLLDEVLDDLVFVDDPNFRLEEGALRELVELLRNPPQKDRSHEDQTTPTDEGYRDR